MLNIFKKLFNSDSTYYCKSCHRVTEHYGNDLPLCKCNKQLKYTDRISESTRNILEIKDEINEDED